MGVPLQIISDHGSDIKKGIRLYQEAHRQVRVTYDITHQSARLLKDELELDKTYSTFAAQCARTRQELQQTPLSFLMPPTQRSKARYFNVDSLLKWATKLLAYQQGQDFSEINPCFCLEAKTLEFLASNLDATTAGQLQSLKNQIYPHKKAFICALQASLSPGKFSVLAPILLESADLGRRYFLQKLGWLLEYRTLLEPYSQMLALVRTLQHQLKHQGLTTETKTNFIKQTSSRQLSPRLLAFKRKLLYYLDLQTAALPPEQSLLGSSDIIESIFGKYKLLSAKSPLKHMGHLILTLPLLTAKLTPELIGAALETVSFAAVSDWYCQVFGLSPLAKRRAVFQGTTDR